MKLTATMALPLVLTSLVILGGCAAADPTGGLLGEPNDELIVDRFAREPKCPAGETLVCQTRAPGRISDGRYGYRGNREQDDCFCVPDRFVDRIF